MSLFPEPPTPPVPKPSRKRSGKGPIKYTSSKVQAKCEDCAQAVYDLLMQGQIGAPMVLQARFKRTQGDSVIYLCAGHRQDREIEEATVS